MSVDDVNKSISKHLWKQKLLYSGALILIVLVVSLLIVINTFKNTHQVVTGTVLNTFVSPTTRSYRPGSESTKYVSIKLSNNEEVSASIPNKFFPVMGDVFTFEVHESILFKRKTTLSFKKKGAIEVGSFN